MNKKALNEIKIFIQAVLIGFAMQAVVYLSPFIVDIKPINKYVFAIVGTAIAVGPSILFLNYNLNKLDKEFLKIDKCEPNSNNRSNDDNNKDVI